MASTRCVWVAVLCGVLACSALSGAAADANARKLLQGSCAVTYGQCGGKTCSNQGSQTCSDSQYRCCPANTECQRHSQFFWDCQPTPSANAPSPSAAAPSSGFPSSPSSPAVPSTPEQTATPGGGVDTTCGQGPQYFSSYLDKSGAAAPDGNYKETCKQITYDCKADTLTAVCGNNLPNVDTAHAYNYSTLSGTVKCTGEIMNVWGILKCQDSPDSTIQDSASGCDSVFSYNSKVDSSGVEAPDGNYKETCRSIAYDCVTDTLYAECGNGQSDDDHAYLVTSLSGAAACNGNLGNDHGVLKCRV